MMHRCGAGLIVWLLAAGIAAAQIPRDPLAASPSSSPAAGAAATATQGALPAAFVAKQAEVEIPFTVRRGATADSQPTGVRIFVSWDQGKSWHFYDERKPEEAKFRFHARQDGEFWFATQTVDRSGRPDSAEPRSPQLRLVIDTQRPQLLVQASVDASGNVNLSWSAADANLVPNSLKLEYQDATGSGGPWQPIQRSAAATNPAQLSGQTTFRAAVNGNSINVRAEIADTAGNMAFYSQKLSLMPAKPAASTTTYVPKADPSATRWPAGNAAVSNPHVSAAPLSQAANSAPAAPTAREEVKIPNLVSNPFVGNRSAASSPGRLTSSGAAVDSLPPPVASSREPGVNAWRASRSSPEPSVSMESLPPPSNLPASNPALSNPALSNPALNSPEVENTPPGPAIAPLPAPSQEQSREQPREQPNYGSSEPQRRSSDWSPQIAPAIEEIRPAPQAAEPIEPATAQRPRLTNSRRFSLQYDIQSVGPEGVAAVELWGTNDQGRTWVKWGSDPDKTSPFDVEVNHEANYGFRIVIVGKNGLATTTPQPGDAADIWVGVDLTRPAAKLTGAAYGQGEAAGKLDIRWQADDANLGSGPVTLAIGDRPDGPFTPIATGLPNTGQYFWAYDPRSPRQIYLRLQVRDDAGNIAIDQLTEPIKVEGLEPKGQIRGFSPGPVSNRGTPQPQKAR